MKRTCEEMLSCSTCRISASSSSVYPSDDAILFYMTLGLNNKNCDDVLIQNISRRLLCQNDMIGGGNKKKREPRSMESKGGNSHSFRLH